MKKTRLFLALALAAVAATPARPAQACGGCFVPPADVTVVTDHRMALSISPQQTILWDQIRYSGDPREFAWVLPVKPGAKIEVANDEFFSALDASTQPVVYGPRGTSTVGCALTGCAADDLSSSAAESGNGGVTVVSQSVVGPYDQATLRATDNDALVAWLRKNQFAIPTSIEPTVAAYVREGFDFIALKLRPECGQRSMRPVRVVSPGAVPTLPLRMVAAGVGPKVGITLYVITEGKYQPQNFPHVLIPDEKLRWDLNSFKSNYEPLSQDLMSQSGGRTWIIEYANKPQLPYGNATGWIDPGSFPAGGGFRSGIQSSPGLARTYYSLCKAWRGYGSAVNNSGVGSASSSSGSINVTPCPETDAGLLGRDAGGADAGDAGEVLDGGESDGGDDAGQDDPGQTSSSGFSSSSSSSGYSSSSSSGYYPSDPYGDPATNCAFLDDLDSALEGLNRDNVWLTRMRSTLPSNALAEGDMLVEPAKLADGRADTETVSNVHWAPYYADEDPSEESSKTACAGAPHRFRRPYASYVALGLFGVAAAAAWSRRRRRPDHLDRE